MLTGLIVSLIIGAVAGWLAGLLVKGHGQGMVLNIAVGILGAVIAGWLFPAIGWQLGAEGSIIGAIIYATLGAVILLLVIRVVNRA